MLDARPVLVVDDDPDLLQLTRFVLTKNGFEVATCSDSTRVIELLQEKQFSCVLLDLRMQGIDGAELLPIIKHHYPELPVIIASAYIDPLNKSYYNSLGAFEILTKPFSDEVLIDVISRAVGTSETIPFVLTSLSLSDARDRVYRKLIVTALRRADWNQVKAAKLLGVSRHCLIRWLRKLKITY